MNRPATSPPTTGSLSRLLPGDRVARQGTLAGHLARHGIRPDCAGGGRRREELIGEVERAGLAGWGGAAFPAAAKLRVLAAARPRPVVIANGVEGEPASDKDKVLPAVAPHLVLDGAVGAAELTGAGQVVIVAHHAVAPVVSRAAERRRAGQDPVPVRVMTAVTAALTRRVISKKTTKTSGVSLIPAASPVAIPCHQPPSRRRSRSAPAIAATIKLTSPRCSV